MLISPFQEAHGLLNKYRETGTRFSHGEKRCKELHGYENNMNCGITNVCIKLDRNKTRVSSRYDLVNLIIRLQKELSCYFFGKMW